MKKRNNAHRGFTLIELLIVIIVVGILASMFLLSGEEAMNSAKASTIISNLRNIKTAALAWHTDHLDLVENGLVNGKRIQFANLKDALGIGNYLNNSTNIALNSALDGSNGFPEGVYGVRDINSDSNTWFAGYTFTKQEKSDGILEKLKAKANSVGLLFGWPDPSYVDNKGKVKDEGTVWLRILGDWKPK